MSDPAPTPEPDDDPQLVARLLDLFGDLLIHRATTAKVDEVAELQHLCGQLTKELAARLSHENDEMLTVDAAARAAGRTPGCIRKWLRKFDLGVLDRRAGILLIPRSKLRSFMLQKEGVLPAGLR
jgi:hypothetical protein